MVTETELLDKPTKQQLYISHPKGLTQAQQEWKSFLHDNYGSQSPQFLKTYISASGRSMSYQLLPETQIGINQNFKEVSAGWTYKKRQSCWIAHR